MAPDIDVVVAVAKNLAVLSDPDLPYGAAPNPGMVFELTPGFQFTAYVSPEDWALAASSWLFGSLLRLGRVDASMVTPQQIEQARRVPEIEFIDDKAGKPVGIHKVIGRRPIAAFGNSDGDFQMLEWVTSAPGPRLGLIVRHDDAEREFAYDRKPHVGQLDRALDEAGPRGWAVVSMKDDWKVIFAPPR